MGGQNLRCEASVWGLKHNISERAANISADTNEVGRHLHKTFMMRATPTILRLVHGAGVQLGCRLRDCPLLDLHRRMIQAVADDVAVWAPHRH